MKTEVQQNQGMEVLQIQSQNFSSLIEPFQVGSTSHEETNYPPGLGEQEEGFAKDKSRRKTKRKICVLNNILSEFPIPFISSMWPEIGDILPNYHREDQTQNVL